MTEVPALVTYILLRKGMAHWRSGLMSRRDNKYILRKDIEEEPQTSNIKKKGNNKKKVSLKRKVSPKKKKGNIKAVPTKIIKLITQTNLYN